MKLRELRGLIRKSKGNPKIIIEFVPGVPVELVPQKTALLAALGVAYDDEATAETGLSYDEDTGILSVLDSTPRAPRSEPIDDDMADDDEDDLL